ncbi:hypothetical protein OB236_32820 [Paenibacillus sp. WQ 127069]|uniref:Uncharacterized protein n=1 Tax=Paenibacillus baimaensis TaxID=2982185 RepID=A0ABT2UQJ1_9BACL|nr:hypothetical protein [Paenibacillus sp. WQ 127069]MCU6796921.1 hypothetical protein [Paenibacillus sp. WQ 127069]
MTSWRVRQCHYIGKVINLYLEYYKVGDRADIGSSRSALKEGNSPKLRVEQEREWVWGGGALASAFEARVPTAASFPFREHELQQRPESHTHSLRTLE